MLAASHESPLVYNFGVCSLQTIPTVPPAQHILHNIQTTTFCFATLVDKTPIDVQVKFTPFQLPSRTFTYHDYEVHCVPEVISGPAQDAIVAISQLLYDRNFLQNAGYRFKFSKQDIHLHETGTRKRKQSERSASTDEGTSDLVWIPQNSWSVTWKNGSALKRPKLTFDKVTIEIIRYAYEDAHRRGRLKSPSLPQLQQNGTPRTSWNPYIIPSNNLDAALLTDDKLDNLHSRLKKVTRSVPSAAEWNVTTNAKSLTPADLRKILQIALGTPPDQQGPLLENDASPIIALGQNLLRYADVLETHKRTFSRAVSVARLIGFSVMRVHEASARECSEKVSEQMQMGYSCTESWHKRSLSFACYWSWMMARLPGWEGREVALYLLLVENGGEKILRDLFKRTLPAAVGEFATILNSEEYSMTQPETEGLPSIIEIVKCLLMGHVDDATLCQAFGCPETYLRGSATDWLEMLKVSHGSMMTIEAAKDPLAPSNSTPGDIEEDIYGGQGILQDLDHYPYAFNLDTTHDLDSLETNFLLFT